MLLAADGDGIEAELGTSALVGVVFATAGCVTAVGEAAGGADEAFEGVAHCIGLETFVCVLVRCMVVVSSV